MAAWVIPAAMVAASFLKDWMGNEANQEANEQNAHNAYIQWVNSLMANQISRGAPYTWDKTDMPQGFDTPGGTPVHMPLYSGGAEVDAYKRAQGIFDQATTSPAFQISNLSQVAGQSKPAIAGATKAINDLFSGARTTQRLAEQAPVNQARINTAAAQRSSVYQNLQARLNELKAKQANEGFVGTSTFDKSTQLREAMPFYQDAANTMSAAKLQNALDEQAIRNQDWQMAFANVNVPYDLAGRNIAFEQMPALSAVNAFNQAYQVYSPFLLEQWQAPTMPGTPPVTPVMSPLGSVAGVGADFLQSYLKNQAAQEAADKYLAAQKEMLQAAGQNAYSTGYNYQPMPGTYNPYNVYGGG